jgi:16S rRNA (cytidine1402-2'-O)-methyltransferase
VVATPIGNLADASARMRDVLASCALVLCEDTRRTGKLLELLGISAERLRRCDEHEEERRVPETLEHLARGEDVALVSDAGTPGISDPGYRIVREAHRAGHLVSPVPGPSAVAAALSCSGLPTSSFAFEGFLPRKRGARRTLLAALADEPRTLVLLETPHRVAEALDDLAELFGAEREAFFGRELTKLHEECELSTLGALRDRMREEPVRGEVVLVVAGAGARAGPTLPPDAVRARVAELVAEGSTEKDALRAAARESGLSRRDVYRAVNLDPAEDE